MVGESLAKEKIIIFTPGHHFLVGVGVGRTCCLSFPLVVVVTWAMERAHVTHCLMVLTRKSPTGWLRLHFWWWRLKLQLGQELSLLVDLVWALAQVVPFGVCGFLFHALKAGWIETAFSAPKLPYLPTEVSRGDPLKGWRRPPPLQLSKRNHRLMLTRHPFCYPHSQSFSLWNKYQWFLVALFFFFLI